MEKIPCVTFLPISDRRTVWCGMMRDIGKNIRDLRQQKHLTQEELAERLFVTRQTISNYEHGRTRPDVDQILRLAEIFDTDANAVLYGPPVPEGRKTALIQAAAGCGLTAAIYLLYRFFLPTAQDIQSFHSYCFWAGRWYKYCLSPRRSSSRKSRGSAVFAGAFWPLFSAVSCPHSLFVSPSS